MFEFFTALFGTGFYGAMAVGNKVRNAAYDRRIEQKRLICKEAESRWIPSVTDHALEEKYRSMINDPSGNREILKTVRPIIEGIVESTPERELCKDLGPTPRYYHTRQDYLIGIMSSEQNKLRIMLAFHGKIPEKDARYGAYKMIDPNEYPHALGMFILPYDVPILRWTEKELHSHGFQGSLYIYRKHPGSCPPIFWRI